MIMTTKYRFLISILFLLALIIQGCVPIKQTGVIDRSEKRKIQVTPKGKIINLYNDSYALVVGNGNYKKGWNPLPGAIQDVKEVANALKKNGFEVTLKIDLTRDDFIKVFTEFALKHGKDKNNRLLFYYAGHGHTKQLANNTELGYLIMIDTPTEEEDLVDFDIKSVDMEFIVTQATKIQAKHVLFMFDSCFSGTILNTREQIKLPPYISDSIKYPVRQFITAGRVDEPVPDHSVFKQSFLDLLAGRDKEPIPDGYLTGEELGFYLKTKVPDYNPDQHPQYGKIKDPMLDKGDFVFILIDIDIEPPTLICPDMIVSATGEFTPVIFDDVVATDNIDPHPKIICKPKSGSTFPMGTTEVKVTAMDSSGNSETCAFKVTVIAEEKVQPFKTNKPILHPPIPNFTDSIAVKMTCNTQGATVRYTIDGSDPTYKSSLYISPINIKETTTIKARAFKDNWLPSDITKVKYKKAPKPPNWKRISLLSAVIFSGTSYYFCKKSVDYNDKYLKEWDRSEAKSLKDKSEDYRTYSLIATGVSGAAFLYWWPFWPKKNKNTSQNQNIENKIEISFTPQKPEVSLAFKF